jgi:biopolymer transport protein ExbB
MLEESLLSFALAGVEWVLWLLVAMSVACVAISLERVIAAIIHHTPIGPLHDALRAFGDTGDVAAFTKRLDDQRGAIARVLMAGVSRAGKGIGSVEEGLLAATTRERMRMERLLAILGTTGAIAPFIGLFGTVLGIIKAFHDLAEFQAEAASAVMAGISEALVATAIGLMVAIPAVVLYNIFLRYNKRVLANIDAMAHIMLAQLKAEGRPLSQK